MFWPYPTGMVVLWIVLVVVLALAGLELLVRPARVFASSTGGGRSLEKEVEA